MQSDVLFFLAVMVFFFILWLAGGGPSKPISWAGPYITPITNTGQTQTGYGEGGWVTGIRVTGNLPGVRREEIRGNLSNAEYQLADLQKEANKQALFGTPSPYKGQVRIVGGNFYTTNPDQEYVTVQVSSSAQGNISLTGWRLESAATDVGETIGAGDTLPTAGGVHETDPIVLQPGEQAYIVTGVSPLDGSFKENMCTGYLGYSRLYYPSLTNRCPSAREEFDRYFQGNPYKDNACYQAIQNTGTCKTPNDAGRVSSNCLALIDNRLNYNGCVASHKNDAYFYTGTWRVYLGRTQITKKNDSTRTYGELWREKREAIKLLDPNGLTVDLYTY